MAAGSRGRGAGEIGPSTQNHIRPAVITVERGTRSNKITPMKTCGSLAADGVVDAVTGKGNVRMDVVLYNTPFYLYLYLVAK